MDACCKYRFIEWILSGVMVLARDGVNNLYTGSRIGAKIIKLSELNANRSDLLPDFSNNLLSVWFALCNNAWTESPNWGMYCSSRYRACQSPPPINNMAGLSTNLSSSVESDVAIDSL